MTLLILIIIGALFGETDQGDTPNNASPEPTSTPRTTSTPTAEPTPTATPTPIPLETFTIQELHAEWNANAVRYNATYAGKQIAVIGPILKITTSEVLLGIVPPELKAAVAHAGGEEFLAEYRTPLTGLPDADVISLSPGDVITAVCTAKEGDALFGLQMEDCRMG